VITPRILGPDCFRALNSEGHQQAYDDMKAEEQREADINNLLGEIGDVPKLIAAVEGLNFSSDKRRQASDAPHPFTNRVARSNSDDNDGIPD
jgi:hypothetical protein